jgi:hypothetical protein
MKTPLQMVIKTLNYFKDQLDFSLEGKTSIESSIDLINLSHLDREKSIMVDFAMDYHDKMCKKKGVYVPHNKLDALIYFEDYFDVGKSFSNK